MRCAWIFAWAAAAMAAGFEPPEVLQRATAKILESARTIPNYTCVETVTRDYFAPAAEVLKRSCPVLLEQRRRPTPDLVLSAFSRDRLRLDVTMSSRGEIFSWPGAKSFVDADVDQVVHHGPMATGSFGGFLIVVFSSDARNFTFERLVPSATGKLLEYTFRVAQPDSHYKFKVGPDSWLYVEYSGTFQLDAATAELVQMTIVTGELPPAVGVCLTKTSLEFQRVQIGNGQFLLPKRVGQRFVYPDAGETENTTFLTGCREFRGESTLTFSPGETAMVSGSRSPSKAPPALPLGLRFTMTLTSPIDFDAAAAGDKFTGRLSETAKDYGGKAMAPKRSVVEGRVLRLQTYTRPLKAIVVLKPEAIWINGARISINAARDWTYEIARNRRLKKGIEILLPLKGEENAGAFRFSGDHVVIPAGFRSDWKTVAVHTTAELHSGG